MSRGRLRIEDERRIQVNYPYLLKELDQIDDLANYMFSKTIFDLDDLDEIKNASPNTRKQKAEVFLGKLLRSGERGYGVFIDALTSESIDSSHIVTQLNAEPMEAQPGPQGDAVEIPIRPGAEGRMMQEKELNDIAGALGGNWESLIIYLKVRPNLVDQIKMQYPTSPVMQIFTCLNKWKQMNGHSATATVLRDALLRYRETIRMDIDAIKKVFQNL